MSAPTGISVKIASKEYQVSCPKGTESQLFDAAQYLDNKMKEIRNGGKVIGTERIAIMAALNIANELLNGKIEQMNHENALGDHINLLQKKINSVLLSKPKPANLRIKT